MAKRLRYLLQTPRPGWRRLLMSLVLLTLPAPRGLVARQSSPATRLVTPGAQYAAGGLHRFLMGDGYRDLWTTPVEVEVLDLHTFAGGLTPLRSHVGSQTTSLRFRGADGREYQFRSVDKHPFMVLPVELQQTIAGRVIQDGVSATHPAGGVIAAALLEAAGVLHVTPKLAVLPDDPALGDFRAEFAGMPGTIEERADENDEESIAFAGALKVTASDRLFERINESPRHRVDERAFLKARLVDLLLGDRDRHRDNWRWARFDDGPPVYWEPISRDHDHAFEDVRGALPALAAYYSPGIMAYGPHYPGLVRLTWNGQEVDRRFFAGLEKPTWDSVATALQAGLTDEVLEKAVHQLPPRMYAVDGASLLAILKSRRDRLVQEADLFYRFLARQVDIHATDAAETALVTRLDDRTLEITLSERAPEAPSYFHRRFHRGETQEIRLRMFGGDDRVVVRGDADPGITLRIVGGKGDDELVDSTRTGGARFYDDPEAGPVTAGRPTRVNRRPYEEWVGSDLDRYPPREWGRTWQPVVRGSFDPDVGVFVGGGVMRRDFGFRKTPYASNVVLWAGITTAPVAFRAAFDADVRFENSRVYAKVRARSSGIEVLRYFGQGNDTGLEGHRSDFFQVKQEQYTFEPSLVVPLAPRAAVSLGPVVSFAHLGKNRGRYVDALRDTLYGAGDFGQVGARLRLDVDTRDRRGAATRGVLIETNGRLYPAVWDVQTPFGSVDAAVAAYFSAPTVLDPTLALRIGGKKVWGTFPFYESAFVGGPASLRGWYRQRFAGDAALYGNAELRLFLTRFFLVLPGDFGVFGLADAGRVYVDGASPGGWHTGVGGGLWFSFLNRANTLTLGFAGNAERTAFSLRAGFDF